MDANTFGLRVSQSINHLASERGGPEISPYTDLRELSQGIEVVIQMGSVSVPVRRVGARQDQVIIEPVVRLVPAWVLGFVGILASVLGATFGIAVSAVF